MFIFVWEFLSEFGWVGALGTGCVVIVEGICLEVAREESYLCSRTVTTNESAVTIVVYEIRMWLAAPVPGTADSFMLMFWRGMVDVVGPANLSGKI